MQETTCFPLWFTLLTAALAVSNLFIFGLWTLLAPSFAYFELGGTAADWPIQFFAVRHIAFGIVVLYGLVRRNATALATWYGTFVLISVMDVALLAIQDYPIPVIGDLSLPASLALAIVAFTIPWRSDCGI